MPNSTYGGSYTFTNPQRSQPPTTSSFEFPPANEQTQFESSHPLWRFHNFSSSLPQPPPYVPLMYRTLNQPNTSLYPAYPIPMQTHPNPTPGFNFNYQSTPDSEVYLRRNGESTIQQPTTTRYVDSQSMYQPVGRFDFNNLPPPPQSQRTNNSTFLSQCHPESNHTTTSSWTAAATSGTFHYTQTEAKKNEVSNKLMESTTVCVGTDFSYVICQDLKKDVLIWPCRHLCVCEKCSTAISLCPLCRKPIEQLITVFT